MEICSVVLVFGGEKVKKSATGTTAHVGGSGTWQTIRRRLPSLLAYFQDQDDT